MMKYLAMITLSMAIVGACAGETTKRGDDRLVGTWTCKQFGDPDTVITTTYNSDGTSRMDWVLDTKRDYVYPVPLYIHAVLDNVYYVEGKFLTEDTQSIQLLEYKENGISTLDEAREEVEKNLENEFLGPAKSWMTIRSHDEIALGDPRTGMTCNRVPTSEDEDR